eukprot:scaffold61573_cov51-Phaeocystis_antarctica.AAC.1
MRKPGPVGAASLSAASSEPSSAMPAFTCRAAAAGVSDGSEVTAVTGAAAAAGTGAATVREACARVTRSSSRLLTHPRELAVGRRGSRRGSLAGLDARLCLPPGRRVREVRRAVEHQATREEDADVGQARHAVVRYYATMPTGSLRGEGSAGPAARD